MAKLRFNYASMASGKSLSALIVDDNYTRHGINGMLFIPAIDTASDGMISSRLGISKEAIVLSSTDNIFEIVKESLNDNIEYIIIDESNFLTSEQVEQCARVVDELNIEVFCYGILTNFQSILFEGSKRLIELADIKREIEVRNICWCKRKAIINARIVNGEIIKSGEQILTKEKEVEYKPLCRHHWLQGKYKKDN